MASEPPYVEPSEDLDAYIKWYAWRVTQINSDPKYQGSQFGGLFQDRGPETIQVRAFSTIDMPPPPPGLSGPELDYYNASFNALNELTFTTNYENAAANEKAIRDAIEYQKKAAEALQRNYATIADDNASATDKAAAKASIAKLSQRQMGDVNSGSLGEYRKKGESFFDPATVASTTTPQEQAAGFLDLPSEMDPADYQIGRDIRRLTGNARTQRKALERYGYNDVPQAAAAQIDPVAQRAAISYNNNAPSAQAARVEAVRRAGPVSYGSMPQMRAATVQGPQARRIGDDELINDAAQQMVFSDWEDPSTFQNIDRRGIDAMNASLGYYGDLIASEGRDAVSEAYFNEKRNEAEQLRRSTLEAALQDLDARGLGRSGAEMQANIQGANQSMKSMHDASVQAAAIAQQRKDAAAANQAMIGEAVRKLQFGEAATMEEAVRQVRMQRGIFEQQRQVENTATLTGTREAQQRALEQQALSNAMYENQARAQNLSVLAAEAAAQNRHQEARVLQQQALEAERAAQQAALQQQTNLANLDVQAADWNARNRYLEQGALQDQTLAANRAIAQGGLTNAASISNAQLSAAEMAARNRYKEQAIEDDYNRLAGAVASDKGVSAAINAGNLDRATQNYASFVGQGNTATNFDLMRQQLQQQQPTNTDYVLQALDLGLRGASTLAAI